MLAVQTVMLAVQTVMLGDVFTVTLLLFQSIFVLHRGARVCVCVMERERVQIYYSAA